MLSATAELLKGGLKPLGKEDNFMAADGAVIKGVFGSVENTFEENKFILELSFKVDGFKVPPQVFYGISASLSLIR